MISERDALDGVVLLKETETEINRFWELIIVIGEALCIVDKELADSIFWFQADLYCDSAVGIDTHACLSLFVFCIGRDCV